MLHVFSKKVVTPVAALLLSMGVNAMQQGQQWDQSQQQCGPEFNLTLPKAACPSVSCQQTKHQVLYVLEGGTTINKKETTVHECLLVQGLTDNDDLIEEYPVEKVCPESLINESQMSQRCQGQQCGPLDTRVLKKSKRVDFDGVKRGNLTITTYTEEDLTFNAGDAHLEDRPCQKITADQFLSHFTGRQASNFQIMEVKDKVDALISELKKGPVLVEDGKQVKQKHNRK